MGMEGATASTSGTNLLMMPGNGGTRTRFTAFLGIATQQRPDLNPVIPPLSGFEGRPMPSPPTGGSPYDIWLADTEQAILKAPEGPWVFYGHGIGGSLLLELARRNYQFPGGLQLQPAQVLLHSCIGASLHLRTFPKLMRPRWVRAVLQSLITFPPLRPVWERRLFLRPKNIPVALRKQFFADYARCAAFPVFFDCITPAWYQQVKAVTFSAPFHFIWGTEERVVAAQYLSLWQSDFPLTSLYQLTGECKTEYLTDFRLYVYRTSMRVYDDLLSDLQP